MNARLFVLAAAATIASAAPRSAASQAIPDRPAPPATPATPAVPATPADSTKDIDATGTYTVYLTAQGNAMTTTTRIDKKPDGSYTGTVNGDGIPPLPVNSVTVTGNRVKLSVTAPDGTEAIIDMIVKGEDITGNWSMANDGSAITGKKTPNP
ncbi:MAG TPA: hypothetical protein VN613_07905 [Gemmatimonadaceae bacterium]|nr:hypothetical protein [Gemmatimonadaceae bacterium]